MTDLRKAAEMALEALLDANNMALMELSIDDAYSNEIDTLRQALAQPERMSNQVWMSKDELTKMYDSQPEPDHGFDRTASHMAGEYVSTKQQNVNTSEERVQILDKNVHEPVAWQFLQDGEWHNGSSLNNHRENTEKDGYLVRDLYTSPPRKEYFERMGWEPPKPLYFIPPRKEWIGLTDDERANCWNVSAKQSALNIEAALRSKNG